METKCSKTRIEEVSKILNFDSCSVVDSIGSSGGLALMWNNKVEVDIFNYSRWHISAHVKPGPDKPMWLFTGFYGHPETAKRNRSWELLKNLNPGTSMAWLCCGDFNEILDQSEKAGGCLRPYRQLESFREAIMDCSLNPIKTQGPKFTWANNRRDGNFTKEKLDRAMANLNWLQNFSESCCHVLPAMKSDHSPFLVQVSGKDGTPPSKPFLFRFEAAWNLKESVLNPIREGWGKVTMGGDVASTMSRRLHNCGLALKNWNMSTNKQAPINLKQKMKLLGELQDSNQGDRTDAVLDHNNSLITQQQQIGDIFTNFFSDLFTTSIPSDIDLCLEDVPQKLTPSMNEKLLEKFSEDEVRAAVFQMKGMGSLGPDGFPALFYQSHWDILGKEVSRLKLVLLDIISSNQSAFVPGRAITDNILVAYETLHSMTTRMKGRTGFMATKLDMSKAYDWVEWDFLAAVMKKMGFDQAWISIILNCISSAEAVGSLSSVPIGKGPQRVSHLFFADDSMIFCKSNSLEWSRLMRILSIYERASGQVLNKEKSSIFFSKNTPLDNQHFILSIVGVKSTGSFDKYLGLPAMVGRSTTAAFHSLIDRTWAKITNWKTKCLSTVGKERKDLGGLGFRNFSSFNLALLAKQGWNILTNPSSLSAQVLKQKYFPSGDLLHAKLSYRPSLAWRSMLAGVKLLKEGLQWSIGNGHSVRVLEMDTVLGSERIDGYPDLSL
ncbi:uncharacterized protein LOC122316153 [Carya illinoinensis]|uniref:uncharacterized protein LOC122316153 n=1 Tax=Carya illinoinensis TaxID=32201 RepID=UPI001C71B1D3|nr:uncharacterized protein LOC122316153 [Carya illinoinensis]